MSDWTADYQWWVQQQWQRQWQGPPQRQWQWQQRQWQRQQLYLFDGPFEPEDL